VLTYILQLTNFKVAETYHNYNLTSFYTNRNHGFPFYFIVILLPYHFDIQYQNIILYKVKTTVDRSGKVVVFLLISCISICSNRGKTDNLK